MAASIQPNNSISTKCSEGKMEKTNSSLFLFPSYQQELLNIVKELKNRTTSRTLNVETKFIKHANPIISFFLSELFKLCLSTGTYPDLTKVEKLASWSSGNAFVSGAVDLRLKSRADQIGHSFANGSSPLRHFFKRSCVARAQ